MPTDEQLQDVLKGKYQLIEKAQEKIKLYQREIESVIEQLSAKRAEMTELARKTVKDYDASIVSLDTEIKQKQAYILNLDNQIGEKIRLLHEQHESAEKKFKNLSDHLVDQYSKKLVGLEAGQAKAEALKLKYEQGLEVLNDDRLAFEATQLASLDWEKKLEDREIALDREKEEFAVRVREEVDKLESLRLVSEAQVELIESVKKEQNEREKRIVDSEARVQAILGKEKDFQRRDKEIQLAVQKNADKEAELNTLNVKAISENRRLSQKEEALRKIEEGLIKRESDLKIAEANFVTKG